MEPPEIDPEPMLQLYRTLLLWVAWLFAGSALLLSLGYFLFLWQEILTSQPGSGRQLFKAAKPAGAWPHAEGSFQPIPAELAASGMKDSFGEEDVPLLNLPHAARR
jgi:hypothetical protein